MIPYIIAAIIIIILFFIARVLILQGKINSLVPEVVKGKSYEDLHTEWYNLSWSGKDPLRVISLATSMAMTMGKFEASQHLASSYYSQIKHLIKKVKLSTAIVFWLKSRDFAGQAMKYRELVPSDKRNPIDLEILGASDFLLAMKLPIVGSLIFKQRALGFLLAADNELYLQERKTPIEASLIWSKLYALTQEERYSSLIRTAQLTRDMDKNQLLRIAKHLNFENLDQLYRFCGI